MDLVAITYGSQSRLLLIEDVLQPTILSYLDGHPHTHLQQDNASPNIARQTINFIREADIYVMP